MTREQAAAIAAKNNVADQVVLLGYRSATSKYGEYDDILAILTPDEYKEFKGNTLPSKWQAGIAKLQPGVYDYSKGLHGISHLSSSPGDLAILQELQATGKDHAPIPGRILPYYAFRQAGPVTIIRDGAALPERKVAVADWPWIDIHHGGYNLTSSLGCQTVYPDHWEEFRDLGFGAMEKYSQRIVKYILIQL